MRAIAAHIGSDGLSGEVLGVINLNMRNKIKNEHTVCAFRVEEHK